MCGQYVSYLNSEDVHDPELPFVKNRSVGGTLLLWNKWLDPYITVYPVSTCSFTPLILQLPGYQVSIHLALYLPTHGKDPEFVSDLASLRICLDELTDLYPESIIFIRGDSNVNKNNHTRVSMLNQLLEDFSLKRVAIPHNTYHHFVGNGLYDSNIDVLLHSASLATSEHVVQILCKHDHPMLLSHHDIILSDFSIPVKVSKQTAEHLVTAPRINNTREKILWSMEGAKQYEELVKPQLKSMRESWLDPDCKASMSVLLQMTNSVLAGTASSTNKSVSLATKQEHKSARTPKAILLAKKALARANKKWKTAKLSDCLTTSSSAKDALKSAQKSYRQAVRTSRLHEDIARDEKLSTILTEKPSTIYRFIRSSRKAKTTLIEKLSVGDKEYLGEAVPDGFFDSMTALKTCDISQLRQDPSISEQLSNYDHIMKLCHNKRSIPPISLTEAKGLLTRMKKNVMDFYSITALHYTNAGDEGLIHFNCLLNAIIESVNNATIEELNIAYGLILHKGHNKEKTSDRSYRTISTCPFLAKALDLYLRDLYHELWDDRQAETQYQGSGSCHELASLLVTEVVQHSLYVKNRPAFLLALDAQSAFDRCLRQILVCELYKAELDGDAITFIDNRLSNRSTVYEWNGELMGPGRDDTGFEQGGINSSDFYKLYNNEQLSTAQASCLGIDLGSTVVSAIGQADDVILATNDIDNLRLLVTLTESYCAKYRVKLVPSKTKLIAYSTEGQKHLVEHAQLTNLVTIGGEPVKFVDEAEHVGVVRNTSGNMPNIVKRISAHKKAMASVLSAGLARRHRGNPAASLRVQQLYGTSVLFSGLASLVLTNPEIKIVDLHHQKTVQNIQRLHDKTPRCVVFLLAGCLPGEAILHIKQLTLFAMICHLPSDPLNVHGRKVLVTGSNTARSWFQQIRELCLQYQLQHPLLLLDDPPSKPTFKRLVKAKVVKYWEDFLRDKASRLPSLHYFIATSCSLKSPHPIWITAASNSFECHKSTILAKMMSGRYRTEYLSRHWSSNKQGYCLADTCTEVVGDLEHLLIACPALTSIRDKLWIMFLTRTTQFPPLYNFILSILNSPPSVKMQFLLDPLAFSELNYFWELYGQLVIGHVYYLVRTFAYNMHRRKQSLLGLWPTKTSKTELKKNIDKFQTYSAKTNITNFSLVPGQPLQLPVIHSEATLSTPSVGNFCSALNHSSQTLTLQTDGGAGAWGPPGHGAALSGSACQSTVSGCLERALCYSDGVTGAECSHDSHSLSHSLSGLSGPSRSVPTILVHSSQ